MKQNPSKLKYKKKNKPSYSNMYMFQQKTFFLLKGILALTALENGKLTYNQIEACRKSIRRVLLKKGLVVIRVFTNVSLTKKPVATRMGKGKGNHDRWVSLAKKGQILCEISHIPLELMSRAIKALKGAASKLPIKTKIVQNFY